MFINEYGKREDPTVVLLAPMMVSGKELYRLMKPYFKGDKTLDEIIPIIEDRVSTVLAER